MLGLTYYLPTSKRVTLLPKPLHVWQTDVMAETEAQELAEALIAESEDGTITALFEEL